MKAAIHRHVLMTTGRTIIGNPDFEQLKITQKMRVQQNIWKSQKPLKRQSNRRERHDST